MIKSTNLDSRFILFTCACWIAVVVLICFEWDTTEKSHSDIQNVGEITSYVLPQEGALASGMVLSNQTGSETLTWASSSPSEGDIVWAMATDSSVGSIRVYHKGTWRDLSKCLDEDLTRQ